MSASADVCMVHHYLIVEEGIKISPVIVVPMSRKQDKKMFPAKVPHLSITFPSLKVEKIPNI